MAYHQQLQCPQTTTSIEPPLLPLPPSSHTLPSLPTHRTPRFSPTHNPSTPKIPCHRHSSHSSVSPRQAPATLVNTWFLTVLRGCATERVRRWRGPIQSAVYTSMSATIPPHSHPPSLTRVTRFIHQTNLARGAMQTGKCITTTLPLKTPDGPTLSGK